MIKDSQDTILFFKHELACRHCGKLELAPDFDKRLKELRLELGLPMIVNSCCRCAEHNRKVGGNPRSFHLISNPAYKIKGTCAIDIKRGGYEYDRKLLSAALKLGWSVGFAKTFMHLDRRSDYTNLKPALFIY